MKKMEKNTNKHTEKIRNTPNFLVYPPEIDIVNTLRSRNPFICTLGLTVDALKPQIVPNPIQSKFFLYIHTYDNVF